ncbi:MFS_1 domain-containing protein [Rhizoctonia solani AG-1 IA]|uniref:MFS_1 domain-containing protein n=1 Tax=Thanatephorus cucumeris (strain AG1-IA) TaxID=983506 RepID=L8X7Z0_THACA|nr:MFS_1 domain-containing protein [Rhizoctonia solani AG-1 IA]
MRFSLRPWQVDPPYLGRIHARIRSPRTRIHATSPTSRPTAGLRQSQSVDANQEAALEFREEPFVHLHGMSLGSPDLRILAKVYGQIIFGHVCDIAPYQYVVIASGAGAALSAYLLWGFAHSLGLIFAFVIVFGSISGGFGSVWPAASVDIAGSEQSAVSNVFGLLAMTKGVAAVIGPLIVPIPDMVSRT